jgi:hypothetical protein
VNGRDLGLRGDDLSGGCWLKSNDLCDRCWMAGRRLAFGRKGGCDLFRQRETLAGEVSDLQPLLLKLVRGHGTCLIEQRLLLLLIVAEPWSRDKWQHDRCGRRR